MAGQPPQGSEDDFLDQFLSMAAGGSYSAAAVGGGRAAGDQPFSLALSLDAAAEASGSGKRLGGDAEGVKAVSVATPRTLLAFAFAPNELVRVYVLKKTVSLLYRTGTLCSCPGSSHLCLAPACIRLTSAPTRLPRCSARCSFGVCIMRVLVPNLQVSLLIAHFGGF
jgi:hypothetical protein